MKTNVTSVPLPSCNSTLLDYGRDRRLPYGVDLGHLCAFDPKAEHDSCQVIFNYIYINKNINECSANLKRFDGSGGRKEEHNENIH